MLADADGAATTTAAGRAESVAVETTVSFDGFDFSAPAEGASAATFSELFADVFQDAAREATTPSRGADIELDAAAVVRGRGARRRSCRCRSRGRSGARRARGDGRVRACRRRSARPALGRRAAMGARAHGVHRVCEPCDGSGRITSQTCRYVRRRRACRRAARSSPRGAAGARVRRAGRRAGRGHAGARGGPAGDLYVTVEVEPHPFFRRVGRDLHLTLPRRGARGGARRADRRADARWSRARLRIPPGTAVRPARLRVRGPRRALASGDPAAAGDLVVDVQIVLPPVTDERSKALLREFGRLNDVDVRQHLFESSASIGTRHRSRECHVNEAPARATT